MRLLFLFLFLISVSYSSSQEMDSLIIPYAIIDSYPQNADVFINDSFEGKTPYRILIKDETPVNVKIKLKGYLDYTLTLNKGDKTKTAQLIRDAGSKFTADKKLVDLNGIHYFTKPRKVLPILLSALLSAGAGFAAYYYKSLSIDKQDEYDITGDPHALDNKSKYDVLCGVSMGVFQVSFAALLYFLFKD